MTDVTVIGLGYIGLPTAALLAEAGQQVHGVDINPVVVESVKNAKPHFSEPGLDEKIAAAVKGGRLDASSTIQPSDIYLIIVPTPFKADKTPDMQYVRAAAQSLVPVLKAGDMVILESTSPVGATEHDVAEVIYAAAPMLRGKLHFAFCPERAIPGNTLYELQHNDRVVGGLTPADADKAAAFYRTFVRGAVMTTTARTAELVKLAENTYRDINIAYANELSLVCERLGVNVWEVIKLANHHPRVNIMQPGPGVGGHCISVDPWFIAAAAPDITPLIQTARKVNDSKPDWVVRQIAAHLQNGARKVGLLGLAFKPDVDDLRESPSVTVARKVRDELKAEVLVAEPHLKSHAEFTLYPLEDVLEQADVVVMLTNHAAFGTITLAQLAGKKVVDTRGVFH